MSEKQKIIIAAVKGMEVCFSHSISAERYVTHQGARMSVARLSEQMSLQDSEIPMAKATLLAEQESVFIPIPLRYAVVAGELLFEFEKIMDKDTTKKHAVINRRELLMLLASMETVFFGSEVVGPEILLPA